MNHSPTYTLDNPDEIELDFDPRVVAGEKKFYALKQFMEQLANKLQRPVLLTPENVHDIQLRGVNQSCKYGDIFQKLSLY